ISGGARAGLGQADLTRIEILGEDLKLLKFRVPLPVEELRRYFPGLTVLGVDRACSGCLQPIISELLALGEKGYRLRGHLTVGLGKGLGVPQHGEVLLVGDCAAGTSTACSISGCPPDRNRLRLELLRWLVPESASAQH
ncbi:MAG: hypothetical protein N3E40_05100, partial [Dehalococcoidia bacterium]|nr:hypothetical protein [Dehalococcoidia bacterium]